MKRFACTLALVGILASWSVGAGVAAFRAADNGNGTANGERPSADFSFDRGRYIDAEHATLGTRIAVVETHVSLLTVRTDNIEDRLFKVFLAALGAALSSVFGAVFSILSYRKVSRR